MTDDSQRRGAGEPDGLFRAALAMAMNAKLAAAILSLLVEKEVVTREEAAGILTRAAESYRHGGERMNDDVMAGENAARALEQSAAAILGIGRLG